VRNLKKSNFINKTIAMILLLFILLRVTLPICASDAEEISQPEVMVLVIKGELVARLIDEYDGVVTDQFIRKYSDFFGYQGPSPLESVDKYFKYLTQDKKNEIRAFFDQLINVTEKITPENMERILGLESKWLPKKDDDGQYQIPGGSLTVAEVVKRISDMIQEKIERMKDDAYREGIPETEIISRLVNMLIEERDTIIINPKYVELLNKLTLSTDQDEARRIMLYRITTLIELYQNGQLEETIYQDPPGEYSILDIFGFALDGILGVMSYGIRIIALTIAEFIRVIITGIAEIGGRITTNGVSTGGLVTIDKILFNEVPITTLNFFDFTNNTANNSLVNIRSNIAYWFYAIRNLAIIISLCVLIYTGVRMVLSTTAEGKADYKRMLMNWAAGFVLIFMLQYIIFITIGANNLIVDVLKPITEDGLAFSYMDQVRAEASKLFIVFTDAIAYTIIYFILITITFSFLITYIKRMINIAFLIVISPLITITYAIDKMADNKSQALNTWLKEFVYGILIQPFHCILYLIFISVSINILKSNGAGLGGLVFSVICMTFILKAEEIIRSVFDFNRNAKSTLASSIAAAGIIGAGIGKVTGMLKEKRGPLKQSKKEKPKLNDLMPELSNTGAQPQQGRIKQTVNNVKEKMNQLPKPNMSDNTKRRIKKAGKASIKMGMALAATGFGAINGPVRAFTYGAGGYAAGRGIFNKIDRNKEMKAKKQNEELFRQAYQIYRDDLIREFGSEGNLIDKSRELLDVENLDSITNPSVREYTKYLQGLRDTYFYTGDNRAQESVIDELKYVQKSLRG
jgi:hypothetical protein